MKATMDGKAEAPEMSTTRWEILVPLDGTRSSRRALPWASALAGDLKAGVKLLHVRPVPARDPFRGPTRSTTSISVETAFDNALEPFDSSSDVSIDVLEGDPGSVLAEQARESYDLVVMASDLR